MLPCLALVWACLTLSGVVFAKPGDDMVSHNADKSKMKFGDKTIERTVQLRTHSIYAPYIDQDLQNRWWDFGGDAYINTNKHVRLTRDKPSQMGWLWSRLPLTSGNWVMEVEFKVSGESTNLFGDGLAIWISKERAQPGPVFGSVDNFEGFALFLDTYANSRHPYAFPRITGMLGDGSTSYNYKTDGDKQGLGACSLNFRRTNVATKVRITYIQDSLIDVKMQYKAWDDWTDCFRVDKISLPNAPFVGFSAMTGDVSDNHDIIAVSTYSAILSHADGDTKASSKGKLRQSSSSSGWGWGFVKFFLFLGVCVGAYYGYLEYKKRNAYGMGLGGGMGSSGGMSRGGMSRGGMGGMDVFGSGTGRGGFGGMYGGGNKRM